MSFINSSPWPFRSDLESEYGQVEMDPRSKGTREVGSDDKNDLNRPALITDTTNVILDDQIPGVYITKPSELFKFRKARIAGYCGFESDEGFYEFYTQPEIKKFCQYYESQVSNSFGNGRPSRVVISRGKEAYHPWNPSQTFKHIFWAILVSSLHLDHNWITKVQSMNMDELPLSDNDLPAWFIEMGSDKADEKRYHLNTLAFVIRFIALTKAQFCGLYQPVLYKADPSLQWTNEDLHRNLVMLRNYVAPRGRKANWHAIPPEWLEVKFKQAANAAKNIDVLANTSSEKLSDDRGGNTNAAETNHEELMEPNNDCQTDFTVVKTTSEFDATQHHHDRNVLYTETPGDGVVPAKRTFSNIDSEEDGDYEGYDEGDIYRTWEHYYTDSLGQGEQW